MAVGVAEAQATIVKRISVGQGVYVYIGTLAFGAEYAAGGDTIGSVSIAEGARFTLPEKLDFLQVSNSAGFMFEYVKSTGKIKAFWTGTALKGVLEEAAAKTSLAALAAVPFIAYGD